MRSTGILQIVGGFANRQGSKNDEKDGKRAYLLMEYPLPSPSRFAGGSGGPGGSGGSGGGDDDIFRLLGWEAFSDLKGFITGIRVNVKGGR